MSNRRDSEATLPPANFASNMSTSPSASPAMNMATAKSMATAAARFVPAMLDPALLGEGLPELPQAAISLDSDHSMSSNVFPHQDSQEAPTWPMLDGSGGNMYPEPDFENHMDPSRASSFRNIALNPGMTTEFSAEYGNGQKPNRPKVRGRFTAARRKEVQEVRKRGACIRCRMLKKPCSGEHPCSTCRNVESARLWKQPCIRTRIADELDMYTSGLHAVLAYHEIQAFKSKVNLTPSRNQIEASHYPETTIYATFKALEGQEILPEQNIDPSLDLGADFQSGTAHHRILDNDGDDLPIKIEAYMKRMSAIFFEKEPSHFMNVTLNTAHQLSIEKQDPLLTKALELWSTVHILVDHELRWCVFEKTIPDAETGHDFSQPSYPSQMASADPIKEETTSYQLICMQLNAAVEKRASLISRTVLSDLERRLLQRNSTSSFETFLAALILLNCVEKSTWLYKSWEQDYLKARWPLDKTPIIYGAQGDRFTEMLHMLLRMRSIPPKTFHRVADGVLACEDQVAQDYFEKLHLSRECSRFCCT